MEDITKLSHDIKKWSDTTFGDHRKATPIIYHLKKEVDELLEALVKHNYIISNGSDREYLESTKAVMGEFADCYMLLIDAASHLPITQSAVLKAVRNKLEINKKRTWGKPDENGVIEHIRDDIKA